MEFSPHTFSQSVSESDIDWLICIEINTSASFRSFLLNTIFQEPGNYTHVRAWRSISDLLGESDLVWLLEHETDGKLLILIENKIRAIAQPEQYERYASRARNYVDKGYAKRTILALASPAKYRSADSDKYGIKITYEAIIDWLQDHPDELSRFVREMFVAAVSKLTISIPVENEPMAVFRRQVWELSAREFPELNMKDPDNIIGDEYWITMQQPDSKVIYKTYKKGYKFTSSVVDLELSGRASEYDALKDKYQSAMDNAGITIEITGKSTAFRITVPCIYPPAYEEDKVRTALQSARKLIAWWGEQKILSMHI